MVLNHEKITAFALKNLEKEKNSEFYPPLERIERKLDAIIDWINWFAKENSFKGEYGGLGGINGKFNNSSFRWIYSYPDFYNDTNNKVEYNNNKVK